jgi:glycogen operon protein
VRIWPGKPHPLGATWDGEGVNFALFSENATAVDLSGSSDLYGWSERNPYASINFVTCHDGFTLHDLVSHERKHNEANGEDNRDGADHNWSRNWGVEGPTDNAAVTRMRERIKRNFLATLAFSQGVPMLAAGDEMGRTQRGNNNGYCQDNDISWIDWELDEDRRALLAFARQVFGILRRNPVLRRRSLFSGRPHRPDAPKDVAWLRPDGEEMTDGDWGAPHAYVVGMLLYGKATDEVDDRGRLRTGDTLLLLVNGGPRSVAFTLPALPGPGRWRELVDTAAPGPPGVRAVKAPAVRLLAHSLILLRSAEGE